jgi:hypothetical protein
VILGMDSPKILLTTSRVGRAGSVTKPAPCDEDHSCRIVPVHHALTQHGCDVRGLASPRALLRWHP